MKIVIIFPVTNGLYKDETQIYADGLSELGHEIIELREGDFYSGNQVNITKAIGADVIWAPFESLAGIACEVKKAINVPIVGHFEVVPPGRVPLDYIKNHWFTRLDSIPQTDEYFWYYKYKHFAENYAKCDVKTITSDMELRNVETLLGKTLNDSIISIQPYPVHTDMLDKYKDDTIKKKTQIITISRLVPHKRIHHMIKALSLIENAPLFVIVGRGPEQENLEKLANELDVKVKFTGLISDKEKAILIQESLFAIHLWAWLPVGECAHYGVPSIAYDQSDTRSKLGKLATYTQTNNIEMLATAITMYLEKPTKIKECGKIAKNSLPVDGSDLYPLNIACEKLINIFKKAVTK